MMQSVFKNIARQAHFNCSKYNIYKKISSLYITQTNNHDNNSKKHQEYGLRFLKYIFIASSGYFGYHFLRDEYILPSVEAAVPYNLSGRRRLYNFISDVVEVSAPSVVYIEIKDTRRFDFFTGRPLTTSNGSGFIIKEDGLIVTNAHVVVNKPNSKLEVRLQNGKTYPGIVEAADMNSDLALVRIQASNLPAIKLGNSSDMRAGEFVVAIGSPLSLSNTCTCGVISSTSRGSEELGLRKRENMVYIQTDAAITFGNSGGPLVNLEGEAIGVNSMKVTAGISFAIPIDYVKKFLEETKGTRQVADKRKYMGITMLTLTPQILHELHERQHPIPGDIRHGILIWKVILGSPAHAGGLQPGDIVTHINGKPVTHVNDIYAMLGEPRTQDLRMSILRKGHRFTVSVVPEDVL